MAVVLPLFRPLPALYYAPIGLLRDILPLRKALLVLYTGLKYHPSAVTVIQ
jgi:hypothetical protein